MNYTSITKQAQITNVLAGIEATVEVVNGSVARVELRDGKGGVLVIDHANYSMRVMRPAPPKFVARYRLHGEWKGLAVDKLFERKDQAERLRKDIEGYPSESEKYVLAIDDVKVDEDAPEAAPTTTDTETIPF
jgi:hypothetical protein